jgi:hypothetical protein
MAFIWPMILVVVMLSLLLVRTLELFGQPSPKKVRRLASSFMKIIMYYLLMSFAFIDPTDQCRHHNSWLFIHLDITDMLGLSTRVLYSASVCDQLSCGSRSYERLADLHASAMKYDPECIPHVSPVARRVHNSQQA